MALPTISPVADAVVAAVRACVGTRFRPQGRVPGLGLDCVGVALVAAAAAGINVPKLPAYSLAGDHECMLDALLAGMCTAVPVGSPGDLMVFAPAPMRRHLAVVTGSGLVHAHAGLMRVVEAPADPGWKWLSAWRLTGEN